MKSSQNVLPPPPPSPPPPPPHRNLPNPHRGRSDFPQIAIEDSEADTKEISPRFCKSPRGWRAPLRAFNRDYCHRMRRKFRVQLVVIAVIGATFLSEDLSLFDQNRVMDLVEKWHSGGRFFVPGQCLWMTRMLGPH